MDTFYRPKSPTRTGHASTAVLLACTATIIAQAVGAQEAAPQSGSGIEEIVVTAQKYKSTILDTPISMSAMSGDQMAAAGITTVTDVARDVPGLSMRSAGPGLTEFEARGLASTGGASPTVGFYLDEVPLSPPALSQSGKVVIDPNLYDVDRVEVLRGPQGTLYRAPALQHLTCQFRPAILPTVPSPETTGTAAPGLDRSPPTLEALNETDRSNRNMGD